jgi:hypothetical protein
VGTALVRALRRPIALPTLRTNHAATRAKCEKRLHESRLIETSAALLILSGMSLVFLFQFSALSDNSMSPRFISQMEPFPLEMNTQVSSCLFIRITNQ